MSTSSSSQQHSSNGEENGERSEVDPAAEFAQAFQELARGEQTATALENQLSAIEMKIEELLARADGDHKELENNGPQQEPAADSRNGDK